MRTARAVSRHVPRGTHRADTLPSKSIERRASRGGVPVFSRPHANPNAFSDSARSRDGGSPTRPAGRWSRPTWIRPLRNVPVVITSERHEQLAAVLERQSDHAATVVRTRPARPRIHVMFGSRLERVRTQALYRRLSACARGDHTAGPRLRLRTLNCRPVASMACPSARQVRLSP